MTNKNYNVNLSSYNEAEALQQLLRATYAALDADNERCDAEDDTYATDQITISVGGIQTAFYLGGPQVDAICSFIKHIADENFHSVDFNNATVTAHLLMPKATEEQVINGLKQLK